MTTNQILQLDCRTEENKEIIQKVLKQIKPLSKFSDEDAIPFEYIEKAIVVMQKKYMIRISNFYMDLWANKKGVIWRLYITSDETLKTIYSVYGLSVYEIFAKAAIAMYSEVKKGIKQR